MHSLVNPRVRLPYCSAYLLRKNRASWWMSSPRSRIGGKVIVTSRPLFIRGDTDLSTQIDISDAVVLLDSLFGGTEGVRCEDAADANDDGGLDISDAVAVLQFLFVGANAPPPPFPDPGADTTPDDLDCEIGV